MQHMRTKSVGFLRKMKCLMACACDVGVVHEQLCSICQKQLKFAKCGHIEYINFTILENVMKSLQLLFCLKRMGQL